jgi:hypothetical protein
MRPGVGFPGAIKKIVPLAFICTILVSSHAASARAEGVGSLIEAGKSMGEAKKDLASEDSNYQRLRKAIDSGLVQKGLARQTVLSQFGEPVVMNTDYATGRERWVYKDAKTSFFDRSKICLFFDGKGMLDEVVQLN